MVFKLVRTDTVEPCKIQLPVGKHLIGRGKLLDCEDKRVSRNHGELEVINDKVVIRALHQNPCFIIKKGIEETQILKQSSTSELGNGDKFGLLPDSYWYELLHCADIDCEVDPGGNQQVMSRNNEELDSVNTEPMNNTEDNNDVSQEINLNETVDNVPDSPSLITSENQNAIQDPSEEDKNRIQNQGDNEIDEAPKIKIESPDTPPKRQHSLDADSNDEVKRIKTEAEVKPDPDDAQAGPSNDNVDSNTSRDKDDDPKSPQQPNPSLRERCIYGANCYRRNPQHKAQFSHPADADWGAGARAPCPYAAACRKRDPRHWALHAHPPGATGPDHRPQPPPQHNQQGNKRRKPKPKKPKSSDDDDDSPAPDLIVPGKRTRKPVNRASNWSGSESEKEEDPFGTDESDEWQPSSDMTDSQLYSQDV